MKAKQLRFKNIIVSSDKLAFKGFIIKNGPNIVNVDFTVTKSQLPVSGTLQQLIIKPNTDYNSLESIIFLATEIHKKSFEIIIDLATEIDFDNIQCVCGDSENNHFKVLNISYKGLTGDWFRFNKPNSIPVYNRNDVGSGYSNYIDLVTYLRIIRHGSDTIKNTYKDTTTGSSTTWEVILKNSLKISTGKHFVETTLSNSDRITGNSYSVIPGIFEAETPYNVFSTTGGQKGVYITRDSTGYIVRQMNGNSDTTLGTFGVGFGNNVVWTEATIGMFVDLDASKIKFVANGIYETAWFSFTKSKPNQEYFIVAQLRNLGANAEFSINYPHKYTYTDLTPDWNDKHFISTNGWQRKTAITVKKSSRSKERRSYINWPWTLKARGLINDNVKYQNITQPYIWRVSEHDESRWGYGYFKNSVFIDYPPKEPTSKRVMLFSINDNEMQQVTWSNPLTGEFEFKNVKMKQPYLIFTYDSDEDYNGVVVGPVYPTLMPKYEGLDLTVKL